jgi:hypothetical protein
VKRLLKEPLAHFLMLGALLFGGYGLLNRGDEPEAGRIVVTQGKVENLQASFSRVWQRPPSAAELEGLVQDYIREEVLAREAMALGLDKDDTIIRRRLRQKMEFISDDIAAQAEPTDAELSAYLTAHPDSFRVEQRFTFSQVYLNPEKHGDNLARDTARLLAQLSQAGGKTDPAVLGDSLLLEHQFVAVLAGEVAKQFGEKFAVELGQLPPGEWHGPVESGYGVHLVLVSERTEGGLPALAEVHDLVRREWANTRRLESNDKFYQELLKRYSVSIEGLEPTTEQKRLAANKTK